MKREELHPPMNDHSLALDTNMQSFQISLANSNDAAEFVSVIRACFNKELLDLTPYGCSGITTFVQKQILNQCCGTDTRYLICRHDNKIVGGVEIRYAPAHLFLNYIAIVPSYRQKGLGTLLLQSALKGVVQFADSTLSLDVMDDNALAMHWYKRLGFSYEFTTQWWSLPQMERVKGTKAVAVGLPQAFACHAQFGFGQFDIISPTGRYTVGLLGHNWFRIMQPNILCDEYALGLLTLLDMNRRMLIVITNDELDPKQWHNAERLMITHRFHSSVSTIIARIG